MTKIIKYAHVLLRLRKYKYSQAKMEVLKCDQIIELRIKKKNVTSPDRQSNKEIKKYHDLGFKFIRSLAFSRSLVA